MNREKKRRSNEEQAQRVTKVQMSRGAEEGGKKEEPLGMFLSITKKITTAGWTDQMRCIINVAMRPSPVLRHHSFSCRPFLSYTHSLAHCLPTAYFPTSKMSWLFGSSSGKSEYPRICTPADPLFNAYRCNAQGRIAPMDQATYSANLWP